MCGIAGIINFNNTDIQSLDLMTMLEKIRHRGPDDSGIHCSKNIGLGFVRLSIIDLSKAGHQPMFSSDNRYIIVFNGEIFNYLEIKAELESEGVVFTSRTDTEVLLQAYIKWGKASLNKLNGMWAFAIYDTQSNTTFAARDRFGVKPFYYSLDNKRFIFSSEIPAVISVMKEKPTPYLPSIFDYLVFNRTDQGEHTFFDNIKKLKHGHCLTIKNNKIKIEEWYNLKNNLKPALSSPKEYLDLLRDSVKLRLRSDVPVGVCLSGGLDSSSIVSVILNDNPKLDLNTFSVVYETGAKGDESEFISLYKSKIKNMHFFHPTSETLFSDMNDFITSHAEPVPSTSPYAQYKVMQLAKEKVTVTLDGQGADEQLGGYHYFFGLYYKQLFKSLRWFVLIKEIIAYKKIHKTNYALKSFLFFLLPSFIRLKLRVNERGYLNEIFYNSNKSLSKTSDTIYKSKTLNDSLLDHFEYKLEHLLKWEDINSMRFSIEARVPFLDYRLVEKTLALNPEMILRNGITKYILREAMLGILPEAIRVRQDKVGFGTPEAEWFKSTKFKVYINILLNSESFKNRGVIDSNKAKLQYQKHLTGEIDASQEIWKWINLELWFREFID